MYAAAPRCTAHRPIPVISHEPAGPPNPAAAAATAIAAEALASGQYRSAAVTAALAPAMMSSGPLAGYSPQAGWLIPA